MMENVALHSVQCVHALSCMLLFGVTAVKLADTLNLDICHNQIYWNPRSAEWNSFYRIYVATISFSVWPTVSANVRWNQFTHAHAMLTFIPRMRSMVWTERQSAVGVISSSSSVPITTTTTISTQWIVLKVSLSSCQSQMGACSICSRAAHTHFHTGTNAKLSKEWPKRVRAERSLSYTHIVKCAVRARTFESWSGAAAILYSNLLLWSFISFIWLLTFTLQSSYVPFSLPQLRIIIIPFWHILSRRVEAMKSEEEQIESILWERRVREREWERKRKV